MKAVCLCQLCWQAWPVAGKDVNISPAARETEKRFTGKQFNEMEIIFDLLKMVYRCRHAMCLLLIQQNHKVRIKDAGVPAGKVNDEANTIP